MDWGPHAATHTLATLCLLLAAAAAAAASGAAARGVQVSPFLCLLCLVCCVSLAVPPPLSPPSCLLSAVPFCLGAVSFLLFVVLLFCMFGVSAALFVFLSAAGCLLLSLSPFVSPF